MTRWSASRRATRRSCRSSRSTIAGRFAARYSAQLQVFAEHHRGPLLLVAAGLVAIALSSGVRARRPVRR
jgi:hypothetical protein